MLTLNNTKHKNRLLNIFCIMYFSLWLPHFLNHTSLSVSSEPELLEKRMCALLPPLAHALEYIAGKRGFKKQSHFLCLCRENCWTDFPQEKKEKRKENIRFVSGVSVSNLLSNTPQLSPETTGAEFVIEGSRLVDTAGCFPSNANTTVQPGFSPHVVCCKHVPSCHSPSGSNRHNCTNQSSPCLASNLRNTWLLISFCQSSSQPVPLSLLHTFPLHRHSIGGWPLAVLWHRAENGNSLFRPFCGLPRLHRLLHPISQPCEIEPLHITYCDPITAPHIQHADESCSWGLAIPQRKKKKCVTIYHLIYTHMHRYTCTKHRNTSIGTHTHTDSHICSTKPPSYPNPFLSAHTQDSFLILDEIPDTVYKNAHG